MISNTEHLNRFMLYLEKYGHVSPSLRLAISNSVVEIELRKDQTLLFRNEVPKKCWFLLSGMVRETTSENGLDKTVWLWFENELIFLNPGFFTQQAAHCNLEVIEKGTFASLSYEQILKVIAEHPQFGKIIESIREQHFMAIREHVRQLKLYSAQQRFDLFYKAHKRVFNVLPVKFIADFLAIHPHNFWRYMRH